MATNKPVGATPRRAPIRKRSPLRTKTMGRKHLDQARQHDGQVHGPEEGTLFPPEAAGVPGLAATDAEVAGSGRPRGYRHLFSSPWHWNCSRSPRAHDETSRISRVATDQLSTGVSVQDSQTTGRHGAPPLPPLDAARLRRLQHTRPSGVLSIPSPTQGRFA